MASIRRTSDEEYDVDFENTAGFAIQRYKDVLENVNERLFTADRRTIVESRDWQSTVAEIEHLQRDPDVEARRVRLLNQLLPVAKALNEFTTLLQRTVHPYEFSLGPLWGLFYLNIKLSSESLEKLQKTTEWISRLRRELQLFNRCVDACDDTETNEIKLAIGDVLDPLLSAFSDSILYLRSNARVMEDWPSFESKIHYYIIQIGETSKHLHNITTFAAVNRTSTPAKSKHEWSEKRSQSLRRFDSLPSITNVGETALQYLPRFNLQEERSVANNFVKPPKIEDESVIEDAGVSLGDEIESHLSGPSLVSVETPSLVSGTTFSSTKSSEEVTGAVEELAALLFREERIAKLIDTAIRKVGVGRFERNFTRLLRTYSSDLRSEVHTHPQQQAVIFVRNHARSISKIYTRQLKQDQTDRSEIFDSLALQDPDRSDLLELFLQSSTVDLPLSVPTPENIPLESEAKDRGSDNDSSESESEGEELDDRELNDHKSDVGNYSHPNLQNLKDFMTNSAAFGKLCENFHNFVYPPPQETATTEIEAGPKKPIATNTAIPNVIPKIGKIPEPGFDAGTKGKSTLSVDESVRGVGIHEKALDMSLSMGKDLQYLENPDEINKRSVSSEATENLDLLEQDNEYVIKEFQTLKRQVDAFEAVLLSYSKSSNKKGKNRNISMANFYQSRSFATTNYILNSLHMIWKKLLRPKVQPGYRRIEWTCDCGQEIYGDFEDSEPEAVDAMLAILQSTAGTSTSSNVPASDPPPSRSFIEMNQSSVPPTRQAGSTPLVTNSQGAPSPQSTFSTSSSTKTPDCSYLALCVNTGEFKKSLVEIEVSKVTSDGQLFALMKSKYRETRGFRARAWFLIKPVSIRFVHFNLFNLRSGYVGLCDMDKPWSIPPVTVRHYKYSPVPLKPLPPMPAEVFLHYFQYGDADDVHRSTCHWLQRLPTRVKARLVDDAEIPAWGWGIYVQEGPNRVMIFWITMCTILVGVLAAIGWSAVSGGDVQGGTSLGILIVGMPTVIMAAFLFKVTAG